MGRGALASPCPRGTVQTSPCPGAVLGWPQLAMEEQQGRQRAGFPALRALEGLLGGTPHFMGCWGGKRVGNVGFWHQGGWGV